MFLPSSVRLRYSLIVCTLCLRGKAGGGTNCKDSCGRLKGLLPSIKQGAVVRCSLCCTVFTTDQPRSCTKLHTKSSVTHHSMADWVASTHCKLHQNRVAAVTCTIAMPNTSQQQQQQQSSNIINIYKTQQPRTKYQVPTLNVACMLTPSYEYPVPTHNTTHSPKGKQITQFDVPPITMLWTGMRLLLDPGCSPFLPRLAMAACSRWDSRMRDSWYSSVSRPLLRAPLREDLLRLYASTDAVGRGGAGPSSTTCSVYVWGA